MFTRQSLISACLGLGFVAIFISPVRSQITPNGAGTVINPQGNQINITGGTQAGGNLFHSFRDFNVNSSQVANFLSNPQIQNILARVNGGNPSFINGLLQVTGGNSNLFLMNPAGIVFGQGASLNIPASFTVTTANQIGLGNNLFNAFGDNNFSALIGNPESFLFTTNQAGSIVNAGNLSVAPGQGINLLGGNVVNTGNINGGNITLAAVPGTNRVRISQPGHILSLEIVPPVDAVISPLDLPRLLTGSDLPGISGNGSTVQVAGVEIPTGQGVNITSGNLGTFSQGGVINILGDRVALVNANLNASGSNGGGTIRVGGEYRGGGVNPFNSRITYVDANSFLNADAIASGNGGRVIVWADDTTRFHGNISARGGASAGNGGFAEVSGAENLTFAGQADLAAPRGNIGTLLLDPVNIFINNGADALGGCALPTVLSGCNAGGDITISQATLQALGAGANILLEASNNITLGTLTGNTLSFPGLPGGGSITFRADADSSGVGDFSMNTTDTIRTQGRNINISGVNITTGTIDSGLSNIPLANGGNIVINATGNVSTQDLLSGVGIGISGNTGNGGNITINAPNGSFTNPGSGFIDSRSVTDGTGNSGNAGNIAIIAQTINAGIIYPYSSSDGSGNAGNGGNVNLLASGNIAITSVEAISGSFQGTARGGDISINSTNGSITSGLIHSYSISRALLITSNSGDAGNINLSASGNITIASFDSTSRALRGTSANAGNISLNSTNGSINVGSIDSYSGDNLQFGNAGNGGNINFLASGNITTLDILANSRVLQGNSATGGNITINSTSGSINTGNLLSSSGNNLQFGNSGNGGAIDLQANGNITTAVVQSASVARQGTSATGGNVRINSTGGSINTSSIFSISGGDSQTNNSGTGGAINLLASGDIAAAVVQSSSGTGQGNSGDGGSITISSSNGSATANSLYTFSRTSDGTNVGSGGNIRINLPNGNLIVNGGNAAIGSINSASFFATNNSVTNSGSGGLISINTGGSLSATNGIYSSSNLGNAGSISLISGGSISPTLVSAISRGGTGGAINIVTPALFRATGSITDFQGTLASITSVGATGGGAITITHGGSTTTPFIIGSPSSNGTVAAISSGLGANTINNLTVPVPPDINNYGTNISIRTSAPTATTPLTSLSIAPGLFSLLTNPTPPPTPAPVVVGTPPASPALSSQTLSQAPAPVVVNTPSAAANQTSQTTPTAIAISPPPTIPQPEITTPLPPILNIQNIPNNLLANFDATSPGIQPPLTTASASSSIPIIERIPIDFLGNSLRLLDQPFKEEFQAFTGIADEIATLDVNQAQDILKRIQGETNLRSVLIYVFFSPENEAEQNARNTSTSRAQLNRLPSNTDILQVVLVPPTGDLIRFKYPNLRRPEVVENANRFAGFVATRSNGYIERSKRIYDWILAPLEDHLKRLKIDTLVFLMDSGLRSMPIAALQNKDGRFIIEDYSVGLMPSLSLTDTTYSSLKDAQVMAMGADRFVVDNLKPLPGVPVELSAISQIRSGNIFFNENFTLGNLRQNRRPDQRIVHLATHGSFQGDNTNSYIQLWGSERLTLDQIRTSGFGTPSVDLLVLSACDTALGDRESELGFAGLAVTSGVRSALASLWQVSDGGTMGLMTEFYQQIQATTTKSEALRQAQLAMLRGEVRLEGGSLVTPKGNFPLNEELQKLGDRRFTHPYFWSAFTMIGNPW